MLEPDYDFQDHIGPLALGCGKIVIVFGALLVATFSLFLNIDRESKVLFYLSQILTFFTKLGLKGSYLDNRGREPRHSKPCR